MFLTITKLCGISSYRRKGEVSQLARKKILRLLVTQKSRAPFPLTTSQSLRRFSKNVLIVHNTTMQLVKNIYSFTTKLYLLKRLKKSKKHLPFFLTINLNENEDIRDSN